MTQEEKQLLLQDLCARLPYGVVVNYDELARPLFGIESTQHFQITLDNALDGEHNGLVYVSLDFDGEVPKPYLRPMSSMTEEEEDEWCGLNIDPLLEAVGKRHTRVEDSMLRAKSQYKPTEWLNAHHFDYRGLIEKGLAIAVTEENNPYEN